MDAKPGLAINTVYIVHPDDVPAFAELSRNLVHAGRATSGCLYFHVAQDVEDNSKFHLLEGWTNQAALDAFSQSETFRSVLKKAMSLRLQDRSGLRLTISEAEPLAMPS